MGNTVAPNLELRPDRVVTGADCHLPPFELPRSYVSRGTQSVHENFELGQTKIVVEAHHPAALQVDPTQLYSHPAGALYRS